MLTADDLRELIAIERESIRLSESGHSNESLRKVLGRARILEVKYLRDKHSLMLTDVLRYRKIIRAAIEGE
jgi:hypothetical protein